jgi:hypothetical protein
MKKIMKKQTTVVIIIAVAILGLFIWFNKSDPLGKKINEANVQKNANLEKMKDSIIKGLVLNISLDALDFYNKNSNSVLEKDSSSIQKMDARVQQIKINRNIDTEYTVHSTKNNFVIRAREKGSSKFYCLDTTTESVEPTLTESADFATTTDCLGAKLK